MQKVKHRIIIDTNLWISFLLTKDLSKIDSLLKGNHAKLLFCDELLEEFIEVANRPKFIIRIYYKKAKRIRKFSLPTILVDLLSLSCILKSLPCLKKSAFLLYCL